MRRGNELGGDEHNVESSNLLEAIEAFMLHVEFLECQGATVNLPRVMRAHFVQVQLVDS